MKNDNKIETLKQFIVDWNIQFPIDRWWRKKYNVSFNSSIHRKSSFIDQFIEFQEEKIFYELEQEKNKVKEEKPYIPGTGNWLKEQKMSEDEYNDLFDNLDLNEFDTI